MSLSIRPPSRGGCGSCSGCGQRCGKCSRAMRSTRIRFGKPGDAPLTCLGGWWAWAVWNSLKNYNKIIIILKTEKNVVSTLKFLFPTKNNGSAPPIMPFSVLLEPFFQVKVGSFLIFKSAKHIYALALSSSGGHWERKGKTKRFLKVFFVPFLQEPL